MARIPIRMPKMSMTMTEGEISSWLAKEGDEIALGDVVCEVMTDKVDMEVESTGAGRLIEIVHSEGVVAVGEPIAWLEGEEDGLGDLFGDDPATTTDETPAAEQLAAPHPDTTVPDAAVAAPADRPEPAPVADERPPAAIPRARGLARRHGVDLAALAGSGPGGLITVADVEAAVPAAAAPRVTQPMTQPMTQPATVRPSAAPAAAPAAAQPQSAKQGRAAMIRAAVARKMTESAAVPQFTVWRDLVLDQADQRRQVSWTTVLLQAYASALREVPELLSRWDAATASPKPAGPPAVALAVATDGGLLVPVFVEPDLRDPADLDREVKQVVAACHAGRLDPSYLGVANGSLSNLGGLGVDRFQALVTPPQASVLALGSIGRRPVAVPGGVGLALTLTAGLTVDHRVGDGAHGARLLEAIAARLTATTED